MIDLPAVVDVPLQTDEHGVILIGKTRVTLDTLIARYQQGDTPEAIRSGFPTISLTDIYAVIAYYLANLAEVDAYLKQRDEEAQRVRQEIENNYTPEQKARTEHFRALLNQKRREQDS
jgi:uncharacterized protein (DUF433 family)